ncbi:unnamed protein product, partial [Schistosoma turkestanicum]
TDRSGESRFSLLFYEDLTIFIQLIGSRLLSTSHYSHTSSSTAAATTIHTPPPPPPPPPLLCNQSNKTDEFDMMSTSHHHHHQVTASSSVSSSSSLSSATRKNTPQHPLELNQSKQQSSSAASASASTLSASFHNRKSHSTQNSTIHFHRIDIITSIGQFINHLFNLLDRGYVLKRIRDLLVYFEISPTM